MPESHRTQEAIQIPDRYFLQPPFCNPDASTASGYEIIDNFDPAAYLDSPNDFGDMMCDAYENTKTARHRPEDIPAGVVDLTRPFSVNGMALHVLCHAVTGDVRNGTSNTRVIPYWDRETVVVGLQKTIADPTERQTTLEILDGLCINVLRTAAMYYVDKMEGHSSTIDRIERGIEQGQKSKENPREEQYSAKALERFSQTVEKEHAVAKLKQLLWLVDQQQSSRIRGRLVGELMELTERALAVGVSEQELALDMGRDTGISEATHRPLYVIRGFVQLSHLATDTYHLPQNYCEQIGLDDLLLSIDRPEDSPPAYEEDKRYRLPLRFGRVSKGVTSLLVRQ